MEEVIQSDYWHIELKGSRKDVAEALKIFPSPVSTHKSGWFTKNIRAYHSGGAVKINGTRAGVACVDSQFPNFENIPGLKHYSPILSAGFELSDVFLLESDADSFMQRLQEKNDFYSLQKHNQTRFIVRGGRTYKEDRPASYRVEGFVASNDFSKAVVLHKNLKSDGVNFLGDIRWSPYSNRFDIKDSGIL